MPTPPSPPPLLARLRGGTVIPALPLALDQQRAFDRIHQRALIRYYVEAGVGGLAVGVHSTQFAIREHGLFEPLLAFTAEHVDAWAARCGRQVLRIAGVCGPTSQAAAEAATARQLGYHAGLLSLAALADASEDRLLAHARELASILPIIGFYLQPAVGGRRLSYAFWKHFAAIPGVVAIKIAPFNRYGTLDVVRAVEDAGRIDEVTLYTGNDDTIVNDLLSAFCFAPGRTPIRIMGGLLGHWAVWTRRAVELQQRLAALRDASGDIPRDLLTLAPQVTDMNAAVFDAANGFRGCIPGIHEVLRRQGLLAGTWCLDPHEGLSPGQAEELTRVSAAYPHLVDDDFVQANLATWLS